MDILSKIETLRREKGWSYYTLALESGLTQSTLTNMFARGTQPSIKTLTALCEAFGISLSEFFSEDLKIARTAEENEMLADYRSLSAEQRNTLRAFLKTLKKN